MESVVHAGAGAVSGGINSAISGGEIGLGMVTSAISAGVGNYAGATFGFNKMDTFGEFATSLSGRMAIGGVTGGLTAEVYGGDFGQGFSAGAFNAGAGFIFNHGWHNKVIPWLSGVFEGSRFGGGTGAKAMVKVGPMELEAVMHDVEGKQVTPAGIQSYSETKAEISAKAFNVKFSPVLINGRGEIGYSWEIGNFSTTDFYTIGAEVTMPHPSSGSAVNYKLEMHLDRIFW